MRSIERTRRRERASSESVIAISVARTLRVLGFRGGSAQPQNRVGAARGVIGEDSAAIEDREITRKIVRRAMANLPADQRALLMLICVDGLSYRETAELLDISIGTVAARIASARRALSKQIALRTRPDVVCSKAQLEPARVDAEGERSC